MNDRQVLQLAVIHFLTKMRDGHADCILCQFLTRYSLENESGTQLCLNLLTSD